MMAQYYGVPPWGMFPAGMMQGGQGQNPSAQQQMMQRAGARPMTPQGPQDAMGQGAPQGMPQGMQGPGQYSSFLHWNGIVFNDTDSYKSE